MRKFFKTLIIAAFLFLMVSDDLFAQGPPPWAPAHGYRAKTRYVYFPDQNMYYDLNARNYIYLSGSNWVVRATLPKLFVGINLGRSSQVELDFVGDRPYRYNYSHKAKYRKAKKHKVYHKKDNFFHDDHGHEKGHGKHKH